MRFTYKLEDAITEKHLRPTIQQACPPEYAALIKECWAPNPKDRPTFADLLKKFDAINLKLAPGNTAPHLTLCLYRPTYAHSDSAKRVLGVRL